MIFPSSLCRFFASFLILPAIKLSLSLGYFRNSFNDLLLGCRFFDLFAGSLSEYFIKFSLYRLLRIPPLFKAAINAFARCVLAVVSSPILFLSGHLIFRSTVWASLMTVMIFMTTLYSPSIVMIIGFSCALRKSHTLFAVSQTYLPFRLMVLLHARLLSQISLISDSVMSSKTIFLVPTCDFSFTHTQNNAADFFIQHSLCLLVEVICARPCKTREISFFRFLS